ncbi:MAG: 30S ribosome-binding factor RbfA [Myxococcales bacterium]|nr:30S ribosome-binding factor RbfA [Myxococcales bacterium]
MATKRGKGGQRSQRIGEQIRQILGELMLEGRFKDPRLETVNLISFTEVRVTSDLQLARVFISVFPCEVWAVEPVMTALQELMPQIRTMVAQQMRIRHTPELRFCLDTSIEDGARMDALIREVQETSSTSDEGPKTSHQEEANTNEDEGERQS